MLKDHLYSVGQICRQYCTCNFEDRPAPPDVAAETPEHRADEQADVLGEREEGLVEVHFAHRWSQNEATQ